jgi:hypothetical protein
VRRRIRPKRLGAYCGLQSFAAEDREQTRYQDKIGNPDEFPYQADNYKNAPNDLQFGIFSRASVKDFTHSSLSALVACT